MAQIKKYTKKDGSKAYMFNLYLGTDPVTGKQRRTTRRGFRTMAEAKTALSRLELEVMENGLPTSKRKIMTFEEVYKLWFEQHKATVKESSAYIHNTIIKVQVLPYFGTLRVDKIDTVYCQKQVNRIFKTLKNYNSAINLIRRIFDYAKVMKQIKTNPMNDVIIPKKRKTLDDTDKPVNFYTKEQLRTFLETLKEHAPYQMYVAFRVMAFTGMRKGELAALKWSDVDFENGTISINKTVAFNNAGKFHIQTPKTRKSIRTISIDDTTLNALKTWKNELRKELFKQGQNIDKGDGFIFHTQKGNFIIKYIDKFLPSFLKKYNLPPIKPHGFRHTHASLLFESGASIKEVQDRLGHENIKTTMDIYTHVTKSAREKTAEKFAKYIDF
ncbi:site-specific integrase [Lactobacillus salivarius]|jgi:integrase|uniref:site-specific integrase n=1 Tax=Ligilactobacillus salivarius TaxID=1624 RepID=UPI00136C244A|nr:site-specific integrase [Ligilactobacillus salivarius]MYV11769.1 site-specific integrase [Ligilactobacillus salivarius]MYY56739.1 site-specific integrase [Ligilactobacillus salivarius]MYY90176.1 site-specific integrase [Ligilactobacillus salivarius]MYZ24085.1 site-specific integrase [Ligilactobacillus salivarius]MYZ68218.1 site-specific integrase [Ligilactobacillus salivarius]